MMDARRIIFMILGAIVAFILFLAIAFYLFPVINPEAEFEGGTLGTIGYNAVDFAEFGPQAVAALKNRISELERQVDEATRKNLDYAEQVDGLTAQLATLESQVGTAGMFAAEIDESGLQETQGGFSVSPDSVIKIVKALFALDDEEISPILAGLSDSQLADIYQQGTNRQREQLLRSLPPNRASSILKRIIS